MSTLTKILIVLLTLASIFLCGIVVTYVATAGNYRQQYNNLRSDRDALKETEKSLKKQLNEKIAEKQQMEDELNGEISSLKIELEKVQGQFNAVEGERAQLLQKVNGWTSIIKDFYETNEKQGQLLQNTLNELKKVQTAQIKERKELKETTTSLVERMAIIETLDAEKKRLIEEKTELQNRMDKLLQPMGKVAAGPVPVTPEVSAAAKPVEVGTRDIDLKGLVTSVDLKNSMASISLGTTDGVRKGMKFYVTRGDEFICNILIIDVDAEEGVGVLELVQQQPRIGDNVSTNL